MTRRDQHKVSVRASYRGVHLIEVSVRESWQYILTEHIQNQILLNKRFQLNLKQENI